jgi:hypothetical protein
LWRNRIGCQIERKRQAMRLPYNDQLQREIELIRARGFISLRLACV